MNTINRPEDYNIKKDRVKAVCENAIPDCVPIISLASSWAYAYAKIKVADTINNKELQMKAVFKYLEEIYTDAISSIANPSVYALIETLKPEKPQSIISEDGYTAQHVEVAEMKDTEYKEFSKDPNKFLKNVIIQRKYPIFARPYPENYEYLKIAYKQIIESGSVMREIKNHATTVLGIPSIYNSLMIMPADAIFDFFRGFKGTLTDVRRRPDELEEAINIYTDLNAENIFAKANIGDVFFAPLHMPTFLNHKQFERFYWPQFDRVLKAANKKGCKVFAYLENNWMPYYDFLQNVPDNTLIGLMEKDDLSITKKVLGKKMAIIGGMPLDKLRYCTKDEAMDFTKKTLDICAPGGGYAWATDKMWNSPDDINIENYKACTEVVRTYGKY